MSDEHPRRRSLDSLRKEAKAWLRALRAHRRDARARFEKALPHAPHDARPARRPARARARARISGLGRAHTGARVSARRSRARPWRSYRRWPTRSSTRIALARPRRWSGTTAIPGIAAPWRGMRTYVQLDLGKRPAGPDDDVDITLEEARHLVAIEHGFAELGCADRVHRSRSSRNRGWPQSPSRLVERDVGRRRSSDCQLARVGRDRPAPRRASIRAARRGGPDDGCRARGRLPRRRRDGARPGGSKRLTDEGVRHLARLPRLKHLRFERHGRHRPRTRGASRAADARERLAGDDACHRSRRRAPRAVPGAAAREPGVDAYG